MKKEISPARLERIRQVLQKRQNDFTLLLDNVWDPHNIAGILRTCDAFGVLDINLYYKSSSDQKNEYKSSGSAHKWVNRKELKNVARFIKDLQANDTQILRTGFSATAKPVQNFDLTKKTCIIIGNEHDGISQEVCELVPDEIYIPMFGMVQSLNVSVATSIIVYEMSCQRNAVNAYDTPTLSPEELLTLEKEWCEK